MKKNGLGRKSLVIFVLFNLLIIPPALAAKARRSRPPRETSAAGEPTEASATPQNRVLGSGRSLQLELPAHAPIEVSNGAVIRLKDLGSQIQVTGIKAGVGNITYPGHTVQIDVISEARYKLFSLIERFLETRRGLRIHAQGAAGGGKIFIDGRLLRFEDWLDLAQATQDSGQEYEFRAEFDTGVETEALAHFKKLILDSGLPDLSVELRPQAHVVLPLTPEDLHARVARVLRPFGFSIESSSSSLALEPSVRVKVIVAEIRKAQMRRLGVKWPDSVSAQLLPQLQAPTDSGLSVDLNALEQTGLGKILASPTLLCRSGKEADFLAGGEFPIKTATQYSASVSWKKYGVMMHIKPRADYSGRMSIGLETEVSMIDTANVVDGAPGLLTNRIETHFDLTRTRTIALSGLLKEEWGRASQGLPMLSSLPILGALFSSRDYKDNKTELIVFVTPSVARPDEEAN